MMGKMVIDLPPAEKALFVACAAHQGMTLHEWVRSHLVPIAKAVDLPPPKWMRKAGFSQRLSRSLIKDDLIREEDAVAWIEAGQPRHINNCGRKEIDELRRWYESRGL